MGWRTGSVVAAAALCCAGGVTAQAIDAGRVYESVQPHRPTLTKPALPSVRQGKAAAVAPAAPGDPGARLEVKAWRIVGATAIPVAQLQRVLQPWTGQSLGVGQLQDAAAAVAQAYRDAGYLYTRAVVLPQAITDGVVTLSVREDRLARLGLEETGAPAMPRFARDAVAQAQPLGGPVNLPVLERLLLRINRLPGAGKASAELAYADANDASQLDVRYQPADRVAGAARADNHGNRYTGSARLLGQLALNNPLGRADRLGATVLTTGAPMAFVGVAYAAPLSVGATLDLAASALRYELCCQVPGRQSDGRASTTSAGLTFDAVVQRDRYVAGQLAMEWRRLASDLDGAPDTRRRVRVLKLGLQGYWVGTAVNHWSATWQGGSADLSGHAPDLLADAAARQVDGGFRKVAASYARAPTSGVGWDWSANLRGQYNLGRNLESSERLALGGPDAVRAHAVGDGLGDSGWVAQLALLYRPAARPGFTLTGFVDTGRVRQFSENVSALATVSPNSYSLTGVGLGVTWAQPGVDLNLAVAQPLGRHRGLDAQGLDADGRRADRTRGWVSLGLAF